MDQHAASGVVTDISNMSGDDRLELNQIIRHDLIVAQITDSAGVKRIPTDKDSVYMLATLLKDSDKSEHTKKKLVVASVSAEADLLAAQTLDRIMSRQSPTRHGNHDGDTPRDVTPPKAVGKELPTYTIPKSIYEEVGTQVDINAITADGRAHFKGEDQEDSIA